MSGSQEFDRFDGEMFFAKRLREHGVTILAGATDRDTRRERIRAAIIECKLEAAIVGRNSHGKPETYAASFERFYGEALHAAHTAKKHAIVKTP